MSLDNSSNQQNAASSTAMNQGNSVQVTKADDEWNVTVVEDGKVWTFEFLVEAHALIFAAGQRRRLGLPGE
jgi:hypothetical protein